MDSNLKKLLKKYNLQDNQSAFIFSFQEGYILAPLGYYFIFEKIAKQIFKEYKSFYTLKKLNVYCDYSYEYPTHIILELINDCNKQYNYKSNIITIREHLIDTNIKMLRSHLTNLFDMAHKNLDI